MGRARRGRGGGWFVRYGRERTRGTLVGFAVALGFVAAGWCIPSGTYDLTVWRSMGNGPSSTITVTLPANLATGE